MVVDGEEADAEEEGEDETYEPKVEDVDAFDAEEVEANVEMDEEKADFDITEERRNLAKPSANPTGDSWEKVSKSEIKDVALPEEEEEKDTPYATPEKAESE